jgi:hypothetical protein
MASARDLLPPAARAALAPPAGAAAWSPQEGAGAKDAPQHAAGGAGGKAEDILAELETREGPLRYAAYASRTAQLSRLAERVRHRP